jgi:hypothetical protein
MRVVFYASVGKKFDDTLGKAFARGAKRHGHTCVVQPIADFDGVLPDTDVCVVVGVKSMSCPVFKAHRQAGRHAVFLDKGYTRLQGGPLGTLYWRVSVDEFQPLSYFRSDRPADRWERLGLDIADTRSSGRSILFAGSSQKFCQWHGLGDATEYAAKTLRRIAKYTDRPVVYRPKPSWGDAVPVEGFGYSSHEDRFPTALSEAHCLVTYGSNACFEALLNGVPTVVLGDGVTRPVSDTELSAVDSPRFPSYVETLQLARDLAYCQWTVDEMAAGECWCEIQSLFSGRGRTCA